MTVETMSFTVPGMTCGHCQAAVAAEISRLDGIAAVDVDLESKAVVVTGAMLDRAAIFAAVDEAGYEAVA
ncbi:MAG TPA: heavy-metal-associated domain-containing protein [Ilumatobacteraceae bacterium]|jgi:copper chaperone CopZ